MVKSIERKCEQLKPPSQCIARRHLVLTPGEKVTQTLLDQPMALAASQSLSARVCACARAEFTEIFFSSEKNSFFYYKEGKSTGSPAKKNKRTCVRPLQAV